MSWTDRSPRSRPKPAPATAVKAAPTAPRESNRETIESIVVAFILALLIRGFEAEAFVIPTGSMAPTLMGRHKEITCPQCGYVYPINASEESDQERDPVTWGTCANCRFQLRVDGSPSFKGDRILVMKFPYDLPGLPGAGGPDRWDVVVFKYPEEPEVNYIKRLVGLPDEDLRIFYGDLMTRPHGAGGAFQILHKPLKHQQAMQMLVYDDAYRPLLLAGLPAWQRWAAKVPGTWTEEGIGQYVTAPAGSDWAELRYHHLVPDPKQWEAVLAGTKPAQAPRPTLITDFYSYNTNLTPQGYRGGTDLPEPHWVGDLTVSFRLQVTTPGGRVRVELVEGGVRNLCEIDLTTGAASLARDGRPLGDPQPSGVRGTGTFDISFANVDNRLTLWVDGRTPFGAGLTYDDDPKAHPVPTVADLDPVGVAVQGAAARVSGLVLKRDIYYTLKPGEPDYGGIWPLLPNQATDPAGRVAEVFDLLADPDRFHALAELEPWDFSIGPGRYLMMGDNSPRSKDSRGWRQSDQIRPDRPGEGWDPRPRQYWEVPGPLLIGKAFFIYWPHGKPFGPDIPITHNFRFPFRPYLERMKWIR
ncbi:MAG TPA: S26 family signal peptidase [Isosphaeraceae bacterium]|jgi:signal peptidase I